MTTVLDIWKSTPEFLEAKSLEQILAMCGDGKLRDSTKSCNEFRQLLSAVSSDKLAGFARDCLTTGFHDSGLALQDVINQIGTRLGFEVEPGRYRGTSNQIGFDGIWSTQDQYRLVVEVKTTDTYRINLDTIAEYRSKLIEQGKLSAERSSILIVVGRQDTGDLEAQIRGSRHAWDVRVISTESLLRLVQLKENLNDWATSLKINEILKPVEYTRVDPIIDLIFRTSEDAKLPETEDAVDGSLELAHANNTIEKVDTLVLRLRAANAVAAALTTTFIKKGRVFFSSSDRQYDMVCLASGTYEQSGQAFYWFGFSPNQEKFLNDAVGKALVALACGEQGTVLQFDWEKFKSLLPNMNETVGRHRHVHVYKKNGRFLLDQPLKGPRLDVTEQLVGASST
jgi:hypothetical protein